MLGGASLIDVDWQQARAGVGYWLAPQVRGRGVASRAVRLRALELDTLGLARLKLICGPTMSARGALPSDLASPAKDSSVAYVR